MSIGLCLILIISYLILNVLFLNLPLRVFWLYMSIVYEYKLWKSFWRVSCR